MRQRLFMLLAMALALPFVPQATWPPIVALTLVLCTHQAAIGLAAGAFSACLILSQGQLGPAIRSFSAVHFFRAFQGDWHIAALLFTLLLGVFATMIEHSGGFQALIQRLQLDSDSRSAKRLQLTTIGTGCLCFFDGLANAVLLGRLYRSIYDRCGLSRDKLAYLVDTTSSAVACIALISTWIATQLSLIQEATRARAEAPTAYELYLQSIPFCFYCTSSLLLALGVAIWNWNIGPMRHAQAQTKAFTSPSTPQAATAPWRAVVPILALILAIILAFLLWEGRPLLPLSLDKFQAAFSGEAGPYALTLGAAVACLCAYLCLPGSARAATGSLVSQGAASMLNPLLILVLAWTFGSTLSELGTAALLAQLLGDQVSPHFLPAGVFACAALTSFLTGSSWGTMSLFMPLALPLFFNLADASGLDEALIWRLVPAVIGAVFGGAVFGDHCSPFSDTTVVSALAAGTTTTAHIRTQLPYALIAAGMSLSLGYLPHGWGLGTPICVALCLGSSLSLPWIGSRIQRRISKSAAP